MKKVVTCFIVLLLSFGCSDDAEDQINAPEAEDTNNERTVVANRVTIPDAAFEQALIDLNFDSELDGEVIKDRIDSVKGLFIDNEGITDLTGIEEFNALETLSIRDNNLTMLDLSRNSNLLFIWAEGNRLEEINVSGLPSLEKLGLDRNNLEQIDVSSNVGIQLLTVSENALGGIDVSTNNALTDFTVVDNPLNCILVNEAQLNDIPTDWEKDEVDSYSLDCQ